MVIIEPKRTKNFLVQFHSVKVKKFNIKLTLCFCLFSVACAPNSPIAVDFSSRNKKICFM